MRKGLSLSSTLVAVSVLAAGCTVQKTEMPGLTGPSELALSVSLAANPDSILQDGGDRSSIVVTARGVNGQPVANLPFRVEIQVAGVPVDYGQLSTRNVVTGADGRATVVYTAPMPLPASVNMPTCAPSMFSPPLAGGCVMIVATPVGSNFQTGSGQQVQIHLVPVGVILPPASTPEPAFTVTPTPVVLNVPANFAGSANCDGAACSGAMTWTWNFGDGSGGSGRSTAKTFTSVGSHTVTLTVTNDRGMAGSTSQVVTVSAGTPPSVTAITVTPQPVMAGIAANFSAEAARAAAGRDIVDFTWNFGDGSAPRVTTSSTVQHAFAAAGAYTVTLTVRDDADQRTTVTTSVSVLP
jgi:PKD repeat protein